ncbi:hypothetical protein DPMN_054681 [Dreissena polymorpha]|uniref:Uncharacterized protein n=1 Tax=Dreissena polymorpha TaxID=45954 RepID=A0A9D4CR58_DREPO|nr:hypothetical protein DPMN_054681 [Dreissena polymorpha]
MLRIILNRLKLKAEELPAEEHAGFRAGLSTSGGGSTQSEGRTISELIKHGGEAPTAVMTALYQLILEEKNWPKELIQPRNYRQKSTLDSALDLARVIIEELMQHQRELFHN